MQESGRRTTSGGAHMKPWRIRLRRRDGVSIMEERTEVFEDKQRTNTDQDWQRLKVRPIDEDQKKKDSVILIVMVG